MAFFSWYGYRDHNGDFFVADRWMETSMLFSAYRPVMESRATAQLIKDSLARPVDYEVLLEVYANTPYPKCVWNVTWSEEFNSWLKETLQLFLLGKDRSVEDTIQAIHDKIVELNAKYGIGA